MVFGMLQKTSPIWVLIIAPLIGCQPNPIGACPQRGACGVLHLDVANEMEGSGRATTEPTPSGAIRLRILIDGVERIDGIYRSKGVYAPAHFQFALSMSPHAIMVEVPGKARCTFGVSTIHPVWASVLFGDQPGGGKAWASYETASHRLREF